MKNDILVSLDDTTHELLNTISLFTEEQFNKIPFEGSWTAAQVAEHLFKSESWVREILEGNTKPTDRQPDKHVETIRMVFLDFESKLKSPDFILPSERWMEQDELYDRLTTSRAEIKHLITRSDLALTFTKFPMPALGTLTGQELATFVICHSKRHINQLKNIHQIVSVLTRQSSL